MGTEKESQPVILGIPTAPQNEEAFLLKHPRTGHNEGKNVKS